MDNQSYEPSRTLLISAGTLFIIFMLASITLLVSLWPDRLPDPRDRIAPLYKCQLFHVRLACVKDSVCCDMYRYTGTCPEKAAPGAAATSQETNFIHLNTLLIILVALGGFAGNLVHISASFATFVGDKKLDRSWLLWYFVTPFSAMGLAVGVYFVFRAGFLSTSADTPAINLFGIMTMAVLTGLFTDIATLKLKEVFMAIFKPKDDRGGKREDQSTINPLKPAVLKKIGINQITLKGTLIDKITGLLITIGGEAVQNIVATPTTLAFSYEVPVDKRELPELELLIKDDKDKVYLTQKLTLQD